MEEKSIFLMGVKRNGKYDTEWMSKACAILDEENYDGTVYLPDGREEHSAAEAEAVSNATLIVCWIDKDAQTDKNWSMPFNYGKVLEAGNVLYGRAPGIDMARHIDWLYDADYSREPFDDLRELMKEAIKIVNEHKNGKVNMLNKNSY